MKYIFDMNRVKAAYLLFKEVFKPAGQRSFGDIGALKIFLARPKENPSLKRELLESWKSSFDIPVELNRLEDCPKGSLGERYLYFLKENQIQPILFSSSFEPYLKLQPVSLRYLKLHDIYHVLFDFKTTIAGEVGLYAFIGEKNYASTFKTALKAGIWIGKKVYKEKFYQITRAQNKGVALAKRVQDPLLIPWEEYLDENLEELRVRFSYSLEPK
jgi:ubiquinone biosynthesis protein Coq4